MIDDKQLSGACAGMCALDAILVQIDGMLIGGGLGGATVMTAMFFFIMMFVFLENSV